MLADIICWQSQIVFKMIFGYPKQVSPQENSNQLQEEYKVLKPQRLVEPDKVTIAFYQ